MDAIAEKLDFKLKQWKPDIAEIIRQHIMELIELADMDALDLMRSRRTEQDVLDLIDEP